MKRLRVLTILCLFMTGALAACAPQPGAGVVPPAAEPAQARTLFNSFEGTVAPAQEIRLSFPTSGLLAEVLVEEGQTVRAGDILARLDTTLLDAEVQIAEDRLASAEAALAKVLAGAAPQEIAEAEYRVQAVGAGRSPYLQSEIEAKAAEQAAAQARLDYLRSLPRAEDIAIAEAHVAEMQSAYDVAVARRAQAQLVAPLDGTVLSVKAHASEFVATGSTVITIADLDQLQVRMTGVLELEVAQFEAGDTVALSFEMLPDEEYEGTIAYMTPGTDPYGNVAFTVLIDLPDAPDGLMLGSTAYVRMKAQS